LKLLEQFKLQLVTIVKKSGVFGSVIQWYLQLMPWLMKHANLII